MLSLRGVREGVVVLGDLYGKLVVHFRVGFCISKPRDDYSGPDKGGGFLSFLLLTGSIGPRYPPYSVRGSTWDRCS